MSFTLGDSGGDRDSFQIRVYVLADQLLLSHPVGGVSRFPVLLEEPGMHRVEIDLLGDRGYTLDDLEFELGSPPAHCDLRTGSVPSLEPPIDKRGLLFPDFEPCPERGAPPDLLVSEFDLAPEQDLPHRLQGGPPLVVDQVPCPCLGTLFITKSGSLVHASFR